jgi:serine/threonine-protein kinase
MPAITQADGPQHRPDWLAAMPPQSERYVLGPRLGQGGAGEVREAWDALLCRTIAIKVLRKMDPVSLLRFMREAQAQSRVVHPHICQIYDVDTREETPRITMQLVRGPTLADAAAGLGIGEIVRIMAQVAEAMHFAHGRNLVHRDLKPSNILLERCSGGGWTPYVCDFGLALAPGDPTLTAPQNVHGTPAYMAPEQLRGDRARIGPATDVFALGGSLRFALQGGIALGSEGVESFPARPRRVGRDLEAILARCLDPDPDRRYPSAVALAGDLWRVQGGKAVRPRPDRARARPPWRRAWRGALLAGLGVGALGLGLALGQDHLAAARSRAQWAGSFTQEAASMEKQLRLEKLLPGRDLRPAYARIRTWLRAVRTRMGAQGRDAQGPGHFALGRGLWLLGDAAGARAELEQAWALGFRTPEAAWFLARALVAAAGREEQERMYASGSATPLPELAAVAARVQVLFHRPGAASGSDDYGAALVAFLTRDYAQAAAQAHTALVTHPWPSEAATLEALSLAALGRKALLAQDRPLAEARFGEAMAAARGFLEADPGDAQLRHAYQVAAREQARLCGNPAALRQLREAGARALRLDPDDPDLQDDWLQTRIQEAQTLADQGRNPAPELAPALAFLARRARAGLAVPLRADRMVIHWLLADWVYRRGGDPGPALRDALRDPGHTPFLDRDYLGELLNLKARAEAARGLDPRPTLTDALARLEPLLGPEAPRSLWTAAAESWDLRARWEAAHGLDPRSSQQYGRLLAARARALAPEPR